MPAHRLYYDESIAPGVTILDPGVGNTTVGSGVLPTGTDGEVRLVVTQAVTQEQRTLKDPTNSGLYLTLILYSTAGANLRINADSKINTAGNTHILMTAADQVVILQSVPYAASTTTKFRWEVVSNDGASLS